MEDFEDPEEVWSDGGGLCIAPTHLLESVAVCKPVLDAIRAVCRDCGHGAFVETDGLLSNLQELGRSARCGAGARKSSCSAPRLCARWRLRR